MPTFANQVYYVQVNYVSSSDILLFVGLYCDS